MSCLVLVVVVVMVVVRTDLDGSAVGSKVEEAA